MVAPGLRELQTSGVVHRVRTPVGDPAWLVTGHAEVLRLLDDDRLGLAHPEPDTAPRMSESALFGGPARNFATEHADHARKRALLQPHFTPNRLRALRPEVDRLTAQLLDELSTKGPPADLHAAVALPLPVLVICELLGVPYEDRDRYCSWTADAVNTHDRTRSESGLDGLLAYCRQLVAMKRRDPQDDLISRLCATEGTSDDEIASLSRVLLWAGYETTVVQIGLGALMLLANPEQWRALVDDPALVSRAVEETLRAKPRSAMPRYARTDLEIGGCTVMAGELVLLSLAAGNHDPSVFVDPHRFDIGRQAVGHLSFGHGSRYCIGAPLARIELGAVFSQLASRFPRMRLATGLQELTFRHGTLFGGLTELRVQW
ncbi:cytochrome P450 [Mycobacterium sp.]|uniref:cytochrome P450 n=1 Tax=Mycobacterium sp. TaxID=1785 RepID=UPI002C4C93B5|nr:cytochrome P450 [Mycobacterium sp.]HTY32552.1 cytochrome P450 [Mycobacterium sp.]